LTALWRVISATALFTAGLLLLGSAGTGNGEALRGLEGAVFEAVNGHRRGAGLPDLVPSDELARIARGHSEAMAAGRADLGHTGFQERTAEIRARMPMASAAENVSKHTRPLSQVPDAALKVWLASRTHRRNLEGRYDTSGVGAARAPSGTIFLTQIFVAR
jgi:uncharacterized protein YkwD